MPLPQLGSPAGALPRVLSQLSYGGIRSTGLHLPSSGLLVGFLLPHPGGLPGLQELPHHVREPHADLHSGAAFSNTTRSSPRPVSPSVCCLGNKLVQGFADGGKKVFL